MELKHYGVLGMHWGIRRYQPYPKGKKPAGAKEVGQAAKRSYRKLSDGPDKYGGLERVREGDTEFDFPTALGRAASSHRLDAQVGNSGKSYHQLFKEFDSINKKYHSEKIKEYEQKLGKKISSPGQDEWMEAYRFAANEANKELRNKYGKDVYNDYAKMWTRIVEDDISLWSVSTKEDRDFLEKKMKKGNK